MPNKKGFLARAPIAVSWGQQVAAGSLLTSHVLFNNPSTSGEVYSFLGFDYDYDVVGGAGATIDIRIVKTAIAATAGTSAISATLPDLTATARTPRKGVISTTAVNRHIMPGSALTLVFAGTLTGLVGLNIVAWLVAMRGIRAR